MGRNPQTGEKIKGRNAFTFKPGKNLSLTFLLSHSGQIRLTGFALFIFMVYVSLMNWLQVVRLANDLYF